MKALQNVLILSSIPCNCLTYFFWKGLWGLTACTTELLCVVIIKWIQNSAYMLKVETVIFKEAEGTPCCITGRVQSAVVLPV